MIKWIFFLFSISPFIAHAQTSVIDGILINAASSEGDTVKNQFSLSGNVRVVFQGQTLTCDSALVDLNTKTIDAIGNVVLDDPRAHLEADRITFNYKTNLGVIHNGFVQSGQVILEGRRIEKMGPNNYFAEDAEFTSCTTCPPGWSFSGKTIEAEVEGYAKIKRPVLKLGGWSVLPLPWLMVPLKSKRQSGLLEPGYEYSQRGRLAISEKYFWAISKSQDATFGLTWHELLGLKFDPEYRYVLSPTSKGEINGSYINDKVFAKEVQGPDATSERWYINYRHMFELPNDYVQRVDWADISDLKYPTDFPDDLQVRGDPAIENRISISKNSKWFHMSAEATYFKNLLKAYPLAENTDSVHKIPEIRLSSKTQQLWTNGPLFKFNAISTHFVRDQSSYDDLVDNGPDSQGNPIRVPVAAPNSPGKYVRDGKFDRNTDLLRTGHRLDASTALSYPFQIGKVFEVLPEVSYREMQYQFELEQKAGSDALPPTAAQRYLQTDVNVKTQFSRVFGEDGDFKSKYKHVIIPEVGYSHIPWIRRPNHAFFGDFEGQKFNRSLEPVSDQDLNGINKIQFDYDDRIFDRDYVSIGLTNQVTRKAFVAGEPVYQTLALFRLSQFYDLNEARNVRSQPWSNVNGQLNLNFEKVVIGSTTSYNPYAAIINTSSTVRFIPTLRNFFDFSYSQTTLVDENNVIDPGSETKNIGVGLGMQSKYWNLIGRVDYSSITREIQSWEYLTEIKPPGNCWYIVLSHKQYLNSEPTFKATVKFNFGGTEG